jgi:hypothetical protein
MLPHAVCSVALGARNARAKLGQLRPLPDCSFDRNLELRFSTIFGLFPASWPT